MCRSAGLAYAPGIGPEEATTWTAGFDIAPPSLPGVKASLTYYDVDYKNRIGTASEDFLRFLSNRDVFGGVIIDNPSLALVQSYFSAPTFSNPFGLAPTDIVAILDGQIRNLSAVRQRGLDFDVGYGRQKGKADTINATNRARLRAALADTNPATAFNIFGNGSANNPATIAAIRGSYSTLDDFESWSAALRGDGPLFRLPGGEVRLAIGAEYRRERYSYETTNDISFATPLTEPLAGLPGPRHVKSAYAELLVPIFGADNGVLGIRKLDLSLAGRIEDYNQFGRTTNPKLGVRWEVFDGIALRGSYGTSFRAPAFDELIGPAVSLYTTFVSPDPASPTGTSNVLALFG